MVDKTHLLKTWFKKNTPPRQIAKSPTLILCVSGPEKPGGGKDAFPPTVVDKHSGLWTRRREFESLPGYQNPYVSIAFSSQNIINLTEYMAPPSVLIKFVG